MCTLKHLACTDSGSETIQDRGIGRMIEPLKVCSEAHKLQIIRSSMHRL